MIWYSENHQTVRNKLLFLNIKFYSVTHQVNLQASQISFTESESINKKKLRFADERHQKISKRNFSSR